MPLAQHVVPPCLLIYLEAGPCYVAQAGPNSITFCPNLLSSGITCLTVFLFIEADFHVAQAGLGMPTFLRLAFNLQSFYPRLWRTERRGVCHHT